MRQPECYNHLSQTFLRETTLSMVFIWGNISNKKFNSKEKGLNGEIKEKKSIKYNFVIQFDLFFSILHDS